jgi:hypothetical protein
MPVSVSLVSKCLLSIRGFLNLTRFRGYNLNNQDVKLVHDLEASKLWRNSSINTKTNGISDEDRQRRLVPSDDKCFFVLSSHRWNRIVGLMGNSIVVITILGQQ